MLRVLAQRLSARSLTLIVFETVLIVASVAVAAYLRLGDLAWDEAVYKNGIAKALLIAAVTQLCLYYTDLYDLRLLADRRELATRLTQAFRRRPSFSQACISGSPRWSSGAACFSLQRSS